MSARSIRATARSPSSILRTSAVTSCPPAIPTGEGCGSTSSPGIPRGIPSSSRAPMTPIPRSWHMILKSKSTRRSTASRPLRHPLWGSRRAPRSHCSRNDTILFDNRIPPRGFTNLGFLLRRAEPVGAAYADSQYWDRVRYVLPGSAASVTAVLYYQTISKEYTDFLRDENSGNSYDWNNWGGKPHTAWETHGKSTPVAMKSAATPVFATLAGVRGGASRPGAFALSQNYPNPFNPATRIGYTVGSTGGSSRVVLTIYDPLGREVASIDEGVKSPGSYEVEWDARGAPSGVYLYRLVARSAVSSGRVLFTDRKKMILIK